MVSKAVVEVLKRFVPEDNICLQEQMAGHTTFRIGGPADCFVEPENEEQIRNVQRYLRMLEIPWFVVGNGSNLLVSDAGFRGVVLKVGKKMSRITVEGNRIVAQAGATMAQVARAAMEHSLTGLEFAAGIPGTVGGGVVMNAGAYGGELCQVVTKVTVLDAHGEHMELSNETMEFGYRTSSIKGHPFIVTEVEFVLAEADKESIKAKMDSLAAQRREKQPLEYPSAGSTFKRPEGYFAGKLIQDAGLRGYQVGGAQVAEKHCGFVINAGGATAADVKKLIDEIRERVQEMFHVNLETEVLFLGFDDRE